MKLINYTDSWKEKWDEFVLRSNNGTIFHLQRFLDYHPPGKFEFHHLLFLEQDNRIVGLLPASLRNGVLESPVGASFGSIVTEDIKYKRAMEMVSALLDYSRKNHIKEIRLTSAPLIYQAHLNQNLDFAMLWQGFKYETHYISSAIQLSPEREIISRFQPTVRNYVRQSCRNKKLRVEINDRYDHFYPIIEKNLSKHGVKPTHSYNDLMRLRELVGKHLKLFVIYHDETPIGGSLLFLCNEQVALCFYNMLLYEYARVKPIHRVMYEVTKYATEHGYRYLDIGVSQDTSAKNPMTPNESLIAFKESFDARTVMRNTLHIQL